MSQKLERCIKTVEEVKVALTHALPQFKKSEFVITLEKYKAEFQKKSESEFENIAERFTKWVKPLLKNVPEKVNDEVRAALHKLNLAVSGRKR